MAYQKAIIAQLKTPQDENGVRYDVFLKTHLNAIITTDDDGNQVSFSELLTTLVTEQTTEIVNNYVTEYDVFTAGTDGLVPGPSESNTTNFLRADGKWAVPVGTTYKAFTGCSSSAAGAAGLVPQPLAGEESYFLRADGGWYKPDYTTYSVFKGMTSGSDGSTGLVPAPGATTEVKYLCNNGNWEIIEYPSYTDSISNQITSYFNDYAIYVSSSTPTYPCLWAKT